MSTKKLASIPASLGMPIIYISHSTPRKSITAIALLDFTNSKVSPQELLNEIKKPKAVKM